MEYRYTYLYVSQYFAPNRRKSQARRVRGCVTWAPRSTCAVIVMDPVIVVAACPWYRNLQCSTGYVFSLARIFSRIEVDRCQLTSKAKIGRPAMTLILLVPLPRILLSDRETAHKS